MSASGERVLTVLEYLALEGTSPLSRVATDLELNKATAHRLLASLINTGYVDQDPETRQYHVTSKLLRLAGHVIDRIDIRGAVRPHLESLAHAGAETAHLAVLEGLEIVYVDKVDGHQAVMMRSRIGDSSPCHCTALGKVLLANQPEAEWRRYVRERGLERRTDQTITDAEVFYAALEEARHRGFAFDDIENEDGIRCIAAPIRDQSGAVVAAMSLSGWTLSMTPERLAELVPVLAAHAERASVGLGHDAALTG